MAYESEGSFESGWTALSNEPVEPTLEELSIENLDADEWPIRLAEQPTELPESGLNHHYDALSQSGVDPLVDQQGSNDLTASGSPTRQSGDINGKDSINVDGSDDLYQGDAAPVGSNGEWTIAWVGRYYQPDTAFEYAFVNGEVGSGGFGFSHTGPNENGYAIAQSGGDVRTDSGVSDEVLHKWILTYDGSNAIVEIDGTVVIDSAIGSPNPSGSLSIGGDHIDDSLDALDFGEFLWYSEYKDSAARQEIRDYFDRWFESGGSSGFTFNSHTYDSSNPYFLNDGPSWEGVGPFAQSIIDVDGTYNMFYVGYTGTDGTGGEAAIGRATSSDLENWTRDGNNPVLQGDAGHPYATQDVAFPAVIDDGSGTYKILYRGRADDGSRTSDSICLATSTDLVSWTPDPNNPVLSESGFKVTEPSAVYDANADMYYMAYRGGGNDSDRVEEVRIAESADLQTWTVHGEILGGSNGLSTFAQGDRVFAPSLLQRPDGFILTFGGYVGGSPEEYSRGLAHSTTFDSGWELYASNPFAARGDQSWFDLRVRESALLDRDGSTVIDVVMGGENTSNDRQIGLATLDMEWA